MPTELQSSGTPTIRTTQLLDGKTVLGTLTAHLLPAPFATLQLLELNVRDDLRRRGNATRLFNAALDDARAQLAGPKLRRVYMSLPHKSAVDIRAFLTHMGFHHVTTTTGIYKSEDLLTYIKSYT